MGMNKHLIMRPQDSTIINLERCSPVLRPGLVLPGLGEPWTGGIGLSEPGEIELAELRGEIGSLVHCNWGALRVPDLGGCWGR